MTTAMKATQFDPATERRLDEIGAEFNAAADRGDETAADRHFRRYQALMNSARRMQCTSPGPLMPAGARR